MVAEHYGEGSF